MQPLHVLAFLIIGSMTISITSCDDCTCPVVPVDKTLTLRPNAAEGKDALVHSIQTTTNYGSHPEISALSLTCSGETCTVRAFFEFDLSALPADVTITDAALSLYSWDSPSNGTHSTQSGSNQSFLQRITSSWTENTITWDAQPSVTTTNQVILAQSTSDIQHYTNIDVTTLVEDMITDPTESYGFSLRLQTETPLRAMMFASSDNTDANLHPKLVIEYKE